MSSTRLTIISDDPAAAPRMSRSLPAALDGIVDTTAFQAFCDTVDGLMYELDAEQRRRKRLLWGIHGCLGFLALYLLVALFFMDLSILGNLFYLPVLLYFICYCTLRGCMARPIGRADAEIIRSIRLECDEMTNHSPFVSFHVVLKEETEAHRGTWLQMSTVNYFAVSISASATGATAATLNPITARFDIISDDPAVAPRMSRLLPAALYDIVDNTGFQTFCDKLDGLFDQLDAEQRRRTTRASWMCCCLYLWLMSPLILESISDELSISTNLFYLPVLVFPILICTVLACTERPKGGKADTKVIHDIRLECEEMNSRSPFVSFQVVLVPVPAAKSGPCIQMLTVDHIAVSTSASVSATGATVATQSAFIASDNGGETNKATENHEPAVAYADGDYVKLV